MTTATIESAANPGNLATGDFQIGTILRRKVVPRFLEDVGRIGWRRRSVPLTVTAGQRQTDLPADFFEVSSVWPEGMKYIGEDDVLVAAAEANTVPGTPSGYWLVPSATAGRTAIRFDVSASADFAFQVFYYYQIPFAADDTALDFAAWVPTQYHWALVELLRREIFFDRFGEGDPRFATADNEYKWWLAQIVPKRELARRNKVIVIR